MELAGIFGHISLGKGRNGSRSERSFNGSWELWTEHCMFRMGELCRVLTLHIICGVEVVVVGSISTRGL